MGATGPHICCATPGRPKAGRMAAMEAMAATFTFRDLTILRIFGSSATRKKSRQTMASQAKDKRCSDEMLPMLLPFSPWAHELRISFQVKYMKLPTRPHEFWRRAAASADAAMSNLKLPQTKHPAISSAVLPEKKNNYFWNCGLSPKSDSSVYPTPEKAACLQYSPMPHPR